MSENEKLLGDFAAAVALYTLATNGNPHIDKSAAEKRVNELERKVASRMKVKEPL